MDKNVITFGPLTYYRLEAPRVTVTLNTPQSAIKTLGLPEISLRQSSGLCRIYPVSKIGNLKNGENLVRLPSYFKFGWLLSTKRKASQKDGDELHFLGTTVFIRWPFWQDIHLIQLEAP